MKNQVFIFFLFFVLNNAFSQIIINGEVKNKDSLSLEGANVLVKEIDTNLILSYDFTNENGQFSISIDNNKDSLQILVTFLGYKTQSKIISSKKDKYIKFYLEKSNELLENVYIKTQPVRRKKDTIFYNVSSFKRENDRVIADVISRIPGIDILDNGAILYQGKPINKYYIEGLDLLEGKYNLANENLPVDDVSQVQILENHQPIKLLDSLVFSDKAAINIKLKKRVSLTGVAKIGAGVKPFLWEGNITPMLFSKNNQIILSYQTNNTGKDLSKQFKTLTVQELLDDINKPVDDIYFIGIEQLKKPPYEQKLWLDNKTHYATINYLTKLTKKTELKTNIYFFNDLTKEEGASSITYLLPDNDITIKKEINNNNDLLKLNGDFFITKNTKNQYLKNTFKVSYVEQNQIGNIVSDVDFTQKTKMPYKTISNRLNWMFPIKKSIFNLKSYISYKSSDQVLTVTPGVFTELLNNNNNYSQTIQQINYNSFYTNNIVGITGNTKRLHINQELGFSIINQVLNSDLNIAYNNSYIEKTDFSNKDSQYFSSNIFTKTSLYYTKKKWKVKTSFLLKYLDSKTDINDINRLDLEPAFFLSYKINNYWKSTFSVKNNSYYGNINKTYSNYILNNYNLFKHNNSLFPHYKNTFLIYSFVFNDPINLIYFNLGYDYKLNNKNVIQERFIDERGFQVLGYIDKNNNDYNHNIFLKISKLFYKIDTKIDFDTKYQISKRKQIINDELVTNEYKNIYAHFNVETQLTKNTSIVYKIDNIYSIVNYNNELLDYNTINSNLNINYFVNNKHYFGLTFYNYFNSKYSYFDNFFIDFIYKCNFKKYNIDFELLWKNISNNKYFIETEIKDNVINSYMYKLRPSQVLFSIKFIL